MEESPLFTKSWAKNSILVDIIYPNKYYGGIYSLAILTLYNLINSQKDFICNRIFLDYGKITANLIGFTFQYEPDYLNFFKILKNNNISINKNRKQIIFAGGPSVNLNHKPLSNYIDFFILGEPEEILPKILEIYKQNKDKKAFLKKIQSIKGIAINNSPEFADIKDLNSIPYPLIQPMPLKTDKKFTFGKCFILETERSCPYSCYFCAIPKMYSSTKIRSLKKIKEIIDSGIKINKRDKVIIYAPSFIHPEKKEILQYLIDKSLNFSVPSLRAELIDEETLDLIKKGNQKTLTIAPECNESLRFKINKPVKDSIYLDFIKLAKAKGFNIKLYLLVGLPNQTKQDLDETIEFINKADSYCSINPFIPKQKTQFQNHTFNKKEIKHQLGYMRKRIKTRIKIPNINQSYLEYKLSNQQIIKNEV